MQLVLDKSKHQVHKLNMNIQVLDHNGRREAHLSVTYGRVRLHPDRTASPDLLWPSPPLSSSDTPPSGSDYALSKTADQIRYQRLTADYSVQSNMSTEGRAGGRKKAQGDFLQVLWRTCLAHNSSNKRLTVHTLITAMWHDILLLYLQLWCIVSIYHAIQIIIQ